MKKILTDIDTAWEPINGPSHEDAWTDEALTSHPVWIVPRARTRQALELLGEERTTCICSGTSSDGLAQLSVR